MLNLTEKLISLQVADCTSGTSAAVPLSLVLHLLVLLLLPGKACRRLAVPAQVSNTRAACSELLLSAAFLLGYTDNNLLVPVLSVISSYVGRCSYLLK